MAGPRHDWIAPTHPPPRPAPAAPGPVAAGCVLLLLLPWRVVPVAVFWVRGLIRYSIILELEIQAAEALGLRRASKRVDRPWMAIEWRVYTQMPLEECEARCVIRSAFRLQSSPRSKSARPESITQRQHVSTPVAGPFSCVGNKSKAQAKNRGVVQKLRPPFCFISRTSTRPPIRNVNANTHTFTHHIKSSSSSTAADTSAVATRVLFDSMLPSFMRLLRVCWCERVSGCCDES